MKNFTQICFFCALSVEVRYFTVPVYELSNRQISNAFLPDGGISCFHLVAEAAVVSVLHDGHELDGVVPQLGCTKKKSKFTRMRLELNQRRKVASR